MDGQGGGSDPDGDNVRQVRMGAQPNLFACTHLHILCRPFARTPVMLALKSGLFQNAFQTCDCSIYSILKQGNHL